MLDAKPPLTIGMPVCNGDTYTAGALNPPLLMLRDYVAAIWRALVRPGKCARRLWTVSRMLRRPGLLKKLLVTGPRNYFGIDFRRAARFLAGYAWGLAGTSTPSQQWLFRA